MDIGAKFASEYRICADMVKLVFSDVIPFDQEFSSRHSWYKTLYEACSKVWVMMDNEETGAKIRPGEVQVEIARRLARINDIVSVSD